MPLANKMAFGCGCCCNTFSDNYDRDDSSDLGDDWDELAGDCSISGNSLTVSSTDALSRCTVAHSSYSMAALCDITLPTDGDKGRIYVRVTDVDNWLAAEIEVGSSSRLRLVQKVSGSESVVATTVVSLTAGTTYTVLACIDGTKLTGVVANSSGVRLADAGYDSAGAPSSYYAGVGTGDTLASTATFDDFMIQKRKPSCQNCRTCKELPYSEPFDTQDPNWQAVTNMTFTGGKLETTFKNGDTIPQAYRCIQLPTGTGWTVEASVTLGTVDSSYDMVLTWGGAGSPSTASSTTLSARYNDGSAAFDYFWRAGGNSGTITTVPAQGDVLKIGITKTDATHADISFYVNGVLGHTESGVTLTVDTLNIGVNCGTFSMTDVTLRFDDLLVEKV